MLLCHAGYEVTTLEDAAPQAHLFVTATGCCAVICAHHMLAMRDNVILCNIGHFGCEVDALWLKDNCHREEIKPQVRKLCCHRWHCEWQLEDVLYREQDCCTQYGLLRLHG